MIRVFCAAVLALAVAIGFIRAAVATAADAVALFYEKNHHQHNQRCQYRSDNNCRYTHT